LANIMLLAKTYISMFMLLKRLSQKRLEHSLAEHVNQQSFNQRSLSLFFIFFFY